MNFKNFFFLFFSSFILFGCFHENKKPPFSPWRVILLGSSGPSLIDHELFFGHSLVEFNFERIGKEAFDIEKVIFDIDGKEREFIVEKQPLLFTYKNEKEEWIDSIFSIQKPPSLSCDGFFKNQSKITFMVIPDKYINSLKEAKNSAKDKKCNSSFEIISSGDFLYFLNLVSSSSSPKVIFIFKNGETEIWPIKKEDKKRIDFLIKTFPLK